MEGRELRKFPKGEHCSECPARRWYLESGFRYCQNGHRVEGFVEYDVDLDDNFGRTGRTVRKQREAKEKQHKHLSGNAARELYLECLQLILRKQIVWLIRERGLPGEIEGVVRDFWDLRVRGFGGLRAAKERKGKKGRGKEGGGGRSDGGKGESSEGEMMLFSSQGESEGESDLTTATDRTGKSSRIKSWAVSEGQKWAMPNLMDTLALGYVACLVMRRPVRIGEVLRAARSGRLLFVGAISEIPTEMRERLPASYQSALQGRYSSLEGGELHRAVNDLVMSYRKNYEMTFPPLNTPSLFLNYLRELALPLEVHSYAEKIVSLLRLDFSFPTKANTPLNNPDTLLIASIVVATKLLYPFDGLPRFPNDPHDPSNLRVNWDKWAEIFKDQPSSHRNDRMGFEKMKSTDVYDMTEEDMDRYLDWYQETKIEPREDVRDLERLFPLIKPVPRPAAEDEDNEATIQERIEQVRSHSEWNQHVSLPDGLGEEDGIVRPGGLYQRYERAEDLAGPARLFHEMAAEYSGLSVDNLVHAVYRLEQKIIYWQRAEKQGVDMDGMEGVEDGVGNRYLARMMGVREF